MELLDEILATCDPVVLATRDPHDIATAASTGRVRVGSVSRADFAMWAASTGMRSKIEDHAANTQSPQRDAALACRDVILGAANSIDFALQPNQYMLGAWVQVGALTQAQADTLLALATSPDPITEYDVRCTLWDVAGTWLGG